MVFTFVTQTTLSKKPSFTPDIPTDNLILEKKNQKLTHTGEKLFACTICHKKFKEKFHPGKKSENDLFWEKPFACTKPIWII